MHRNGSGSTHEPSVKDSKMPPSAATAPSQTGGVKPESRTGRSGRASSGLPDATLVRWLREMYLIREFENRCA